MLPFDWKWPIASSFVLLASLAPPFMSTLFFRVCPWEASPRKQGFILLDFVLPTVRKCNEHRWYPTVRNATMNALLRCPILDFSHLRRCCPTKSTPPPARLFPSFRVLRRFTRVERLTSFKIGIGCTSFVKVMRRMSTGTAFLRKRRKHKERAVPPRARGKKSQTSSKKAHEQPEWVASCCGSPFRCFIAKR